MAGGPPGPVRPASWSGAAHPGGPDGSDRPILAGQPLRSPVVARPVNTRDRAAARQNSYLTHRANADAGRHGWLRLTPAYSVRLVRERTAHLPPGAVVTDPFSGSGTTVLAAAEHGGVGQAVDVNPFLVWLGNAKAASYPAALLAETRALVPGLADQAAEYTRDAADLWAPNLHNIARWWSPGSLAALKALRYVLDQAELPGPAPRSGQHRVLPDRDQGEQRAVQPPEHVVRDRAGPCARTTITSSAGSPPRRPRSWPARRPGCPDRAGSSRATPATWARPGYRAATCC